jgi:hypothetical protein
MDQTLADVLDFVAGAKFALALVNTRACFQTRENPHKPSFSNLANEYQLA